MADMNFIALLYVKYRPSSARRRLEARMHGLNQWSFFTYATAKEIEAEFAKVFGHKKTPDVIRGL